MRRWTVWRAGPALRDAIDDLLYLLRHPWARRGAFALGGAIVLLAVTAAATWPLRNESARLEDEIAARRRALVSERQAEELARDYHRALADLPRFEAKLDRAFGQAQVIEELGRLARRRGVRILAQSFDDQRLRSPHQVMAAELTVQASYGAIRDWMTGLGELPFWIEVQELRLEAAREPGVVQGRIHLAVFRRGARAPGGGAGV